ncbi:MAG: hypothetical protein HKN26_13980 [Acidimicrobiales bacterium]|nr:hypothetical protein [Acidimicrobiales bacterium]
MGELRRIVAITAEFIVPVAMLAAVNLAVFSGEAPRLFERAGTEMMATEAGRIESSDTLAERWLDTNPEAVAALNVAGLDPGPTARTAFNALAETDYYQRAMIAELTRMGEAMDEGGVFSLTIDLVPSLAAVGGDLEPTFFALLQDSPTVVGEGGDYGAGLGRLPWYALVASVVSIAFLLALAWATRSLRAVTLAFALFGLFAAAQRWLLHSMATDPDPARAATGVALTELFGRPVMVMIGFGVTMAVVFVVGTIVNRAGRRTPFYNEAFGW